MSEHSLADTIVPKSDQMNADDLLARPITVTIAKVARAEGDQPVAIHLQGDYRPYKPCKSMRRVLIAAWGDDGREWVGRSMTIYNDPEVTWGGVKVGGIRISHLTDIPHDIQLSLTAAKGKRKPYTIKKLTLKPTGPTMYPEADFATKLPAMLKMLADGKMTRDEIIARCEKTGKLTEEQKARIVLPQPETTNADDDGIFE